MAFFDSFLGKKQIQITPEKSVERLFSANEVTLGTEIKEIQGGYTEEHGLHFIKIFPGSSYEQKEKLLFYLAACKNKHSVRVLKQALIIIQDENPQIREMGVGIFPHNIDVEFIDIMIDELNKPETTQGYRECINKIIADSGVVQELIGYFQAADRKGRLKILQEIAELQNPSSYELVFNVLKEEKTLTKSKEKKPLQREMLKLLPKFKDPSFLNFIIPRIHLLDPSALYEVFTMLRVYGEKFYQALVKHIANRNSSFQHKSLTIIHRMQDEDSYWSLFTTFFGNPNKAIEEETEVIIGKLLKKFADKFERSQKTTPEILNLREKVLAPLETRLRDPDEEHTLFMCEHIIRFGMIWPEVLMRNLPAMSRKHQVYLQKLFQGLPEQSRFDLFIQCLLFPEFATGEAILELISSSNLNYHREIMPELLKKHFPEILPELQEHLVKRMLNEKSVLAQYLDLLLNNPDPGVKIRIIDILEACDNAAAWKHIKSKITDTDIKVRRKILEILRTSKFDNTQIVIYLINFLKDSNEDIVITAIEILSEKNHPAILASFSKMLTHNNEKVQRAAKKGIIVVTKRKYLASFESLSIEMKYKVGFSLINMDPKFVEELSRDIGAAEDPKKRLKCAQILEVLADHLNSELQVHLIVAISDPDPKVRATIIMALGRIGGPAITNMLVEYLNDEDARVRANTVEAFGNIGDKEMIEHIIPCLDDTDNRTRGNAIITLWKLEYFDIFETIGKMIHHTDKWMRASAVYAMGELKDMRFINFLMMSLKDKDEDVRRNAVIALDKLHPTQFLPIFQQMRFDQNEAVRLEIQNILDKFKKK
ncbi:HEAT repeat domain-containing protein [Candidatus Riflebacteria bacterium]